MALAGLVLAVSLGAWGSVPFLVIYTLGLSWVGGRSLLEGRRALPNARRARLAREASKGA